MTGPFVHGRAGVCQIKILGHDFQVVEPSIVKIPIPQEFRCWPIEKECAVVSADIDNDNNPILAIC